MPRKEFNHWRVFYMLWPFDDLHRYYRPAALVAGAMSGDDDAMRRRLEWLQPDPMHLDMGEADVNTLRAFGLKG